jgi:hypothetical protein
MLAKAIPFHFIQLALSFPGSAFTLRLDGIERVFRAERTHRSIAG